MAGGRRSHGQGTFWGDLIGPNPTDRGKAGTKRRLLVDGEGGPLSIVVAGANVHDAKLLEATLDAVVVERPQPTEEEPQHLCLDKGYDNPSGRGAAAGHGYREHIRRIGEEKLDASGDKRYPARRWVVERTLAWLSKCRAVLVRYDKKAANYLVLERTMKVVYDQEVDVLRIVFSTATVDESDEEKTGVVLDYDSEGNIVGLEVLGASKRIENPKALDYQVTG